MRISGIVFVAALAAACAGSATTPSQTPAFSTTDLAIGSGVAAVAGNTLTVDYTGWLYDPSHADLKGLQFDSSTGFAFALGTGQVIKGWDQGLVGMSVGGSRRLIIPPSLGYGGSRNSKIPPNAALVFDIRLTGLQ